MKKIPSVFARNYDTDRRIRDEVTPGCEWVIAGEGNASRKWDGTACLARDSKLYKRYDAKRGKLPPEGWEPCEPAPDEKTGHWPGWLPVGDGNEDRWHRFAFYEGIPDGTYELVGPKVNGGNDGIDVHTLIRHGSMPFLPDAFPRTFVGIGDFLKETPVEGVVFHHADGRMAKVKARDYGLPWPPR